LVKKKNKKRNYLFRYLLILFIISSAILFFLFLTGYKYNYNTSREAVILMLSIGFIVFSLYITMIPVGIIRLDREIKEELKKRNKLLKEEFQEEFRIKPKKKEKKKSFNSIENNIDNFMKLIKRGAPIIIIILFLPFWAFFNIIYIITEPTNYINIIYLFLLIEIFIILMGYFMFNISEYIIKSLLLEMVKNEYYNIIKNIIKIFYPIIKKQEEERGGK